MDSAILRYTQPTGMILMQYSGNLYAKSCKGADLNDESTLIDIFIEGVDDPFFAASRSVEPQTHRSISPISPSRCSRY